DPEKPTLDSAFLVEIVGALDRPCDRFLAEIVGLGASPRHSVAVRPQTFSAALDGGLDDGGSGLRHGFYSLGRSSGVVGYGRRFELPRCRTRPALCVGCLPLDEPPMARREMTHILKYDKRGRRSRTSACGRLANGQEFIRSRFLTTSDVHFLSKAIPLESLASH